MSWCAISAGRAKLVAHCSTFDRLRFRALLDAYRNTRQPGNRYAHRATDLPAGSSSPMRLVNPPVALMFHEGARRVLASGAHIPALHDGDEERVALEAYAGLLVRKQLGIRDSYKSDTSPHAHEVLDGLLTVVGGLLIDPARALRR